ncbi:MAG: hypothetical protein O9972_30035, partial [Burkholderiales bacterium]|nr:hypothetical protein [Burkholderiales bacterium]
MAFPRACVKGRALRSARAPRSCAGPSGRRLGRTFYNSGFPSREPRMSIKSDRWIRRMAEQHG